MKADSMTVTVREVRRLGVRNRIEAIRLFRSKGFHFVNARKYVDEILAGARWWKCYR